MCTIAIFYIHAILYIIFFLSIIIDDAMEGKMCQNILRETTSIQSLPEELKTKIFLELPMKDIFSVCLVCKQWNYIVMNNESVWKLRCYNLPEFLHKNFVNDRAQGHNWKVNTGILIYTMKINNCNLRQFFKYLVWIIYIFFSGNIYNELWKKWHQTDVAAGHV